jgi:hypothetical protein
MSAAKNMRNRTIRWPVEINALAERLAAERGLFGGGQSGVSGLLTQLVREEAQHPRLELQEASPGYAAKVAEGFPAPAISTTPQATTYRRPPKPSAP